MKRPIPDISQNSHLIFYDGNCPLCNRTIRFLLYEDKKKIFYFAPLNGKTAREKKVMPLANKGDTLILIQDYRSEKEKIFVEGKGVLRIFWLLGGRYTPLGLLSFLPPILFNLIYRLVARNRYRLFKSHPPFDKDPRRFLP